nr:hypothetical protein [Pseudomonas sp. LTJR-52]
MGDPAGQAAYRFHFLGLTQGFFSLLQLLSTEFNLLLKTFSQLTQGLLSLHALRYIRTLTEDSLYVTLHIKERLINKINEPLFARSAWQAL